MSGPFKMKGHSLPGPKQKKRKPDTGPKPPKKTARNLWIENNPRKPYVPKI
tara:strand:- start:324 stop:476 length:153 start_codon:yes stop_codon:yes gene_type:complete